MMEECVDYLIMFYLIDWTYQKMIITKSESIWFYWNKSGWWFEKSFEIDCGNTRHEFGYVDCFGLDHVILLDDYRHKLVFGIHDYEEVLITCCYLKLTRDFS